LADKNAFLFIIHDSTKKPLKQKQKKIADDFVMEDTMATFDE
jgi:hypothetical protein